MTSALAFHFDFISPFGYFASLRIEDLAARHGRGVEWHPMLLGISVMKVMGLKPLLDTPLKGPYTERDVLRYAREHSVPMLRQPRDAVMNPLTCGRALAWVNRHQPQRAAEVVHAIYGAYWGQGLDLSTPESLVPVVGEAIAQAAASDEAAAHCEYFNATDEEYFSNVWFWTTPIEQCIDGRTDVTCTNFQQWTDAWLTVKVWGVTIVSLLFGIANMPMLLKHGLNPEEGPPAPPPVE